MHIGYFNDRQELGFSCSKDIDAVKQLSDLKNILKNPAIWIITKGKQTFILIFLKRVLVAVFIFLKFSCVQRNVDWSPFPSFEVYQSCVSKLDTSGFLTVPFPIPDSIFKFKGGSDQLNEEKIEKLVKSILAKTPQSLDKGISINKFLKRILELIDPVISDQRFWRIFSEYQKPLKSGLSHLMRFDQQILLVPLKMEKRISLKSEVRSHRYLRKHFRYHQSKIDEIYIYL
jgi:hypothetical protein